MEHVTWELVVIASSIVIGVVFIAFVRRSRRLRDPRLDKTWSDDERAPYDAPASRNPTYDSNVRMVDPGRGRPRDY